MSNLKKKIARLDAKLKSEEHDIRNLHDDFADHPTATRIMLGMLASGFTAGLVLGKTFKFRISNIKRLVKIPIKISQIVAATKFITDKFHT